MNPVLFDANETDFNSNGLGVLSSCVSCIVEEEANGIFDLEMEYPMDGIHFKEIADRCIIKAKPNHYRNPQLFRVYSVEKSGMGGIATIYAHHISYDLSGIPVSPFKAGNLQDALLGIKSHSVVENPFTFNTDKNVGSTYSVKTPKSARSAIAGSEGSLLQTYKGDLEFDNFVVTLHSKRGQNRGVSIRYGKNLTDIDQDRNCEAVYTGVYPFWASTELDDVLELPEKVVHAEGEYPFTKILVLDFSPDFIEKPTTAQIRNKAQKYIKDNNIGKPDVSLTVEFAQMQESEEYKNLTLLEQVDLFDEVNVEFPQFGVSSTAKVVKVVYDAVLEKIKSVSLGSVKANISDTIVAQQKEIEETPKNSDLLRVQEAATAWLTNGKGYKVERRDELGRVIDTLYMDTPDIETAVNVMRVGQSGIGFSHNGVNGPYISAWTIDGQFVADFITTGSLSASLIKTGTLDASAINVINLIAEKLLSTSGSSSLSVSGAEFQMTYNEKETCYINNEFGNSAQLGFRVYNESGVLEKAGYFNASQIEFGGSGIGDRMCIGVDTETKEPYMILPNDPTKMRKLSWKDNGDGTFALVGK